MDGVTIPRISLGSLLSRKFLPLSMGIWIIFGERAKPFTVTVREAIGGDSPGQVVLRALNTDDTLYVMAQWPDDTKSDMRDPYIWNAEKKAYDRPSKPDDQFALEFPMTGDFNMRMITLTHEYVADVWHWKPGAETALVG